MKKKVISALLCMSMVASMLAGCAQNKEDDSAKKDTSKEKQDGEFDWKKYDGTTISVMFNEHNYSKAAIQKISEFEKKTGIRVKYTTAPESNYFDSLKTALSGHSGNPDVYMTGGYQIWEYVPEGYMEPLDKYINDPTLTNTDYNYDDFISGVAGALKWNGKSGQKVGKGSTWAVPMGCEINNLAYNKKVLKDNGISVPKTTEDLSKAAKKLKGFNGTGSYGIAVRGTREWSAIHPGYMSLFATWGAQDFAVENGKLVCKLDSKEAIEMTDYWVNLVKEGGSIQSPNATWSKCSEDLTDEKAAMMFDASAVTYACNNNSSSKAAGNIAWTGIPLPDGKTTADEKTNVWVWGLAMNKDSKNKEAAWYFMQYFTSPEYQLWAGVHAGATDTPRTSIMKDEKYKASLEKSDNYLEYVEALEKNASIYFTPQPHFEECATKWAETLQDLITGNKYKSTEQAMKKLKKNLDKIVSDVKVEE